jgi:DNA-binding NarL/FixJ family response regulator
MKKTISIFSILILCVILLFEVNKFTFFKGDINKELIIAIIAIAFFFIGIYLNKKSFQRRSNDNFGIIDYSKIKDLKISNREYDVLLALNEDLTNKQIADKLFISVNTTKKHLSKVFSKLEVSKRTEALKKAKKLNLIKS